MKGLINHGSICYFNSALQCLLQVPQLSNFFILKEYKGDCEFTNEYKRILKECWLEKVQPPVANPMALFKLFKRKFSQFSVHEQGDCQEVIFCILAHLKKK